MKMTKVFMFKVIIIYRPKNMSAYLTETPWNENK